MHQRMLRMVPQGWAQVAILMGFCVIIYFVNLGQWDLWSPDEPRYAQVAREMTERGDWILMHFNGRMYTDKPPLFFWLVAFSSYLWQGFTSFSVRFPSAFFGTLTVLLTFFLGKSLFGSRKGFLGGLVLATSFQFAFLSTRANIDATLTFFTTFSLLCFLQWYRGHYPQFGCELRRPFPSLQREKEDRGSLAIYGFYIGMALGTLAKGPVGFILPLLVSLAYLIIQKDWKGLRKMKPIQGMILFLLIVLAWYLPALGRGGEEYFNQTIMHHTVDRFAKGSSHIRPFYYYFYNFPADFLPWFCFLPAAIAYSFSEGRMRIKKEFLFLLVWFAVIFIFFSISKGKRGLYLLPLYPAVSLMVGNLWDDVISASTNNFREAWFSVPLYLFSGLILIAGAAIPWVLWMKFPSFLIRSLPIAFFLVVAAVLLFVFNRLRYRAAIFFLIVVIAGVGFFYTLRVVFPAVNPYKSARFISQEVTSRIQPGEKLAIYGDFVIAPYIFFTEIVPAVELKKSDELVHFLQSEGRVYCILKFRDYDQFQKMEGKPNFQFIVRRTVGSNDMVLISNR